MGMCSKCPRSITMAEINTLSLLSDPNLQGYWRMEDNWNDSSANGYNLTANNSPTFVTGKFGKAGNFVSASSQSSSIARASCANIRISGSQSWGCWVNPTTLSSYQAVMGMANTDGSNSATILLSADSGNVVYFTLPGLTTNTQVNSGSATLTTGSWQHIVGVYNTATSTLKIYINGVEANSVTASGSKTDISSGAFRIGARGDASVFVNSAVDDVFIFNRALTADEILTIYRDTSSAFLAFM